MKEKPDYQHIILHSVGTKEVGIRTSKQEYAAIQKCLQEQTLQNKKNHTQTNKQNPHSSSLPSSKKKPTNPNHPKNKSQTIIF